MSTHTDTRTPSVCRSRHPAAPRTSQNPKTNAKSKNSTLSLTSSVSRQPSHDLTLRSLIGAQRALLRSNLDTHHGHTMGHTRASRGTATWLASPTGLRRHTQSCHPSIGLDARSAEVPRLRGGHPIPRSSPPQLAPSLLLRPRATAAHKAARVRGAVTRLSARRHPSRAFRPLRRPCTRLHRPRRACATIRGRR